MRPDARQKQLMERFVCMILFVGGGWLLRSKPMCDWKAKRQRISRRKEVVMARIIEFYVPAKFHSLGAENNDLSLLRLRNERLSSLRSLDSPQGPIFTRRRRCALSAAMIVVRFIAIAPTLMGRLTPHRINIPAAAGMATTL